MTYLPGLRASLVKAARQLHEDVPEPQRPRRWLTASGIATALAAGTAVAVAVVALVALGHRLARNRAASSSGVTRLDLRAAAVQALEGLKIPSDAVPSGLVRGTPAELFVPSSRLGIRGGVDVYRVWRLHERPDRVIQFLEANSRPGSSPGFETQAGSAGSGRPFEVQLASGVITFPATADGIWRQLALDAVTLRGGGTALRVDSEAGWLEPRPASELIPRTVTRAVIAWVLPRREGHGSLTITNPIRVHRLVSVLNSLPSGPRVCKGVPAGVIRFLLFAGRGKHPLAVARWDPGCPNLLLTIGRGSDVLLTTGSASTPVGGQFYPLLATLLPRTRVMTPSRVPSSGTTVHSSSCASSSAPGLSQSAPGAAGGSCTSVYELKTTSGSAH